MTQSDYWLGKWKIDDIAFHQEEINSGLIKYFPMMNLKSGDNLLVPLCGKTHDMHWLAEQQLNIIGIELSQIACNDFFAEMNITPLVSQYNKNFILYEYKNIKIFCGDIFNLSSLDLPKIEAIYDCKSLIALPVELRKKYIQQLLSYAEQNTKILLITIDTEDYVIGPPFPISLSEVSLLFGENFNFKLLETKCSNNLSENLKLKNFKEIIENIMLISLVK
jgi:thiopurine S-methyltransferase